MRDVADRSCARAAPEIAAGPARDALWRCYVGDWERGVSYIPGAAERIAGLAARFELAIVTNTHAAELVERHLAALGLRSALHRGSLKRGAQRAARTSQGAALFSDSLLAGGVQVRGRRISESRSGLVSSRTRCGWRSPPR